MRVVAVIAHRLHRALPWHRRAEESAIRDVEAARSITRAKVVNAAVTDAVRQAFELADPIVRDRVAR